MTYEERCILRLFTSIQQKCYEPTSAEYCNFGAHGTKMADVWKQNYPQFAKDVGPRPSPRHTLVLIKLSGDFAPGNVQWVDVAKRRAGRKAQRGELTDEQVVEILNLVHNEKMPVESVALGYPACSTHIRNIALGHTRKIEGYPYPCRLYCDRTLEQIEQEEAVVLGLWALAKETGASMKDIAAWAKAIRNRKAPVS